MEPDEQKIRKVAHVMVQNLAGHLAVVHAKEPMRTSLVTHLRGYLQPFVNDQNVLEQAVEMSCEDNLEFACSVIERATAERAMQEVDVALSSAYTTRKKHREVRSIWHSSLSRSV